ncbi:hypothetical protein BD626DRAFT_23123 [Schizophyllum amplum]|uniref:Uncharacterized protein n=1 Tax=Schizophyllum amplum TaxID=97359 RepID=A0A550CZ61_9AGAR|nr:hypothetical protein BD626DRAFT_23123 [Auriculariopsis ampla]
MSASQSPAAAQAMESCAPPMYDECRSPTESTSSSEEPAFPPPVHRPLLLRNASIASSLVRHVSSPPSYSPPPSYRRLPLCGHSCPDGSSRRDGICGCLDCPCTLDIEDQKARATPSIGRPKRKTVIGIIIFACTVAALVGISMVTTKLKGPSSEE